jgi:hypothetical protein
MNDQPTQATPVCSCCDRPVPFARGSMWHHYHRICLACFYVWYDTGLVEPIAIKDYVLKAEGENVWPFGANDEKFRRVS